MRHLWSTVGLCLLFSFGGAEAVETPVSQGPGLSAYSAGSTRKTGEVGSAAPDILRASLSRGHYLLLKRGLQIQALVFPVLETTKQRVGFNLSQFRSANFTTVNLWWNDYDTYTLPFLGAAPGVPWGRVTGNGNLHPGELPYLDNLVSLEIGDEQDISDKTNLQEAIDRIALNKKRYPDVLSYTNQMGCQNTVAQMRNYMARALPDMLSFDTYPFFEYLPGGSPRIWYEHVQKYRLLGLAGNDGTGSMPIPYSLYTQTWVYCRPPSESEMRLNEFAAWAFGYTFVNAYLYNSPGQPNLPPILFKGVGDSQPNRPTFNNMATLNAMSRSLGPALVRLISTDVRMRMGRHHGPRTHGKQGGKSPWEEENALPTGVSAWSASADPYMTAVSAANPGNYNTYIKDDISGSRTVRLPGDVILGYFKPLHEAFDGPDYSDQRYFMVVNGLCDVVGNAFDCRQSITIDFNFGTSGINGLQRMKRRDRPGDGGGEVETITAGGRYRDLTFTTLGNNRYRMILTLDGGTGDLFKYNTGAPFVAASGRP